MVPHDWQVIAMAEAVQAAHVPPRFSDPSAPVIEVRGVSKTFGGTVRALDNVNLSVRRNEIVGLLGANGAGKSTLMKILVGVHRPDAGELLYGGVPVEFPASPKEAAKKGISIVSQENGVIPSLQVYQFLLLGHEEHYRRSGILQVRKMKEQSAATLEEFGVRCHPEDFMHELPLSTQKMVEIARAILGVRLEQGEERGNSVILLDEPTAPLTIEERKQLLDDLVAMKSRSSFIFVTHIMQEALEYMDRIFVLRDGRLVGEYDMSNGRLTDEDLTGLIVGTKGTAARVHRVEDQKSRTDEPVLQVRELSKRGVFYDVSFELRKGECLGIFGPLGSGNSEVLRSVAGLLDADSGTIVVKGREVPLREEPHARLRRGIGYLSGESRKELFLNWSIKENVGVLNMKDVTHRWLPILRFGEERKIALRVIDRLKVKVKDADTPIATLSGGNKQKVTLGKWLQKSPDILALEDPTIGIDVGSRADLYETIHAMKAQGIAILLVSDDEKEYAELCDRILFLRQGRVDKVLEPKEFLEVVGA